MRLQGRWPWLDEVLAPWAGYQIAETRNEICSVMSIFKHNRSQLALVTCLRRMLVFCLTTIVIGGLAGSLIADPAPAARARRVLYNFDGDSCLISKAGSKGPAVITADDVKRLIDEVAYEGSQVDTVLVCVNAQVMYYPTKVGTQRGTLSSEEDRAKWPASEQQRFKNVKALFDANADPYSIMLAETRKRGREALLAFRMNDDHGNEFLRTKFWIEHPEWRLSKGALNFDHAEVRDYTVRLIEEAVRRYDCDGIELDFNRFPIFFKDSSVADRIQKMNGLVQQVRKVLDDVGGQRNRRMVLGVRVPSNYNRTPPTLETCHALGCDIAAWAKNGWIDFVTVSEFLYNRSKMPLKSWTDAIGDVPVYGGIECYEGKGKEDYLTADKYRREAAHLQQEGADGIYLFNFFTTREFGPESWEPPFEVLRNLYTAQGKR